MWAGSKRAASRGTAIPATLALLAATGCGPTHPSLEPLVLQSFRQAAVDGVLLNESLQWIFDDELDRMSVTQESVRILDGAGRPARGTLEVEGRRLRFLPALPRGVDLGDGGFAPGRSYSVELAGFPRPDGLRARDGRPLARTEGSSFRVVGPGSGAQVFVDPHPGPPLPLQLAQARISDGEPIALFVEEPVDPTTLLSDDFVLTRHVPAQGGGAALERVPVAVRLSENTPELARLELRPVDGTPGFAAGRYHLWIDPNRSALADLSGQRLPASWVWGSGKPAEIAVRAAPPSVATGRWSEDFSGRWSLSPEPVPGADGTLVADEGTVRVRWPNAAGNGVDGQVRLSTGAAAARIAASSLVVEQGETVDLPASGFAVWRAQGRMEIRGRLMRQGPTGAGDERDNSRADRLHGLGAGGRPAASQEAQPKSEETLTEFLARAEVADSPWTVLVAGGDLWISGELRTNGVLVLVAGGWVRIAGPVVAREVWVSERWSGASVYPQPTTLPVLLDEPQLASLVEPLVFAAYSPWVRPQGGVARWRGATWVGAARDARIRFLGERVEQDGSTREFGPVEDAAQLGPARAIRLLVEVRMGRSTAGELWRPQVLDRVELWYDPPEVDGIQRGDW